MKKQETNQKYSFMIEGLIAEKKCYINLDGESKLGKHEDFL